MYSGDMYKCEPVRIRVKEPSIFQVVNGLPDTTWDPTDILKSLDWRWFYDAKCSLPLYTVINNNTE
jgi:hypothetical protein